MRGMYSEAKSPIRPKTFFTPSKDKRNGFFGPPEDILNKTTIKDTKGRPATAKSPVKNFALPRKPGDSSGYGPPIRPGTAATTGKKKKK